MANNLGCQLDRTWDQLIPKLCSPPTGDSLNQVMEAGRATLNLGSPSGGSPEKKDVEDGAFAVCPLTFPLFGKLIHPVAAGRKSNFFRVPTHTEDQRFSQTPL